VRWRVRVRLSDGRRLSRSFPELVDAQNWRDQQLISQRHLRRAQHQVLPEVLGLARATSNGSNGAVAAMPLAVFFDKYWPKSAQKKLAPRTLRNYRRAFERFIEPSPLGQQAVATVDAEDILDWQERCEVDAGATTEMIRT
jgi:hypothetical protein